jgi:hypothetical protein
MASLGVYQSARTHHHYPLKDRSQSVFPPHIRIDRAGSGREHHPYLFQIDGRTIVKVAGFNGLVPNTESTRHLYSTGTSQLGTLVVTDNMTACIAVACAAEKIHPETGNRLPGAKIRVFHLLPFTHQELMPDNVMSSINTYLEKAKQEGLTLRIAMHGGDPQGDFSLSTAAALRNLFEEKNIPLEFDETCQNRTTDTPLGAVIRNDHSVQFVTQIVSSEPT